jgi:hypothetical protein
MLANLLGSLGDSNHDSEGRVLSLQNDCLATVQEAWWRNERIPNFRKNSGVECFGTEFADAAIGAYDEGQREGVPVFVGVGGVLCAGFEGAPVAAVVTGDVGAVGAYGDPGFGGGVVRYGAAVAVGWSLGGFPVITVID